MKLIKFAEISHESKISKALQRQQHITHLR